jgi:hypothetical protein
VSILHTQIRPGEIAECLWISLVMDPTVDPPWTPYGPPMDHAFPTKVSLSPQRETQTPLSLPNYGF